ncbi:ABC transporter ATP-binding protein [Streptomyces violascens]|uniref:ABC transporter ATP-binding protein n=1 Tax=Streptomyces violascens TaxID=67381 RepID=A0ABQ3QKH7_9ACTN|nr:ABC transporter ATP-binding protein [Streptomyces violascens]GHI37773.1 ABC transporter ATP-binding protein [Streptomyces violascens]
MLIALLRRHKRVLLRLAGWSLLESAQTFLLGFALARALDDGFLAGRAATGLGWLAAAAVAVFAGAWGTRRVYGAVAAFVEPVRDELVRAVVTRGLREADDAALSRLTQQVELARDTLAGLVLVARTFVFTAAGALFGLFALAPVLLPVIGCPLLVGLALFAATLGPLARRQEDFLAADERLAAELGLLAGGLRDIEASGAHDRAAASAGERIDDEYRAARSLAYWGVARTFAVGIGGRLPLVLLLVTAPWLLRHGVTAGGLAGALAYLTQSLLPALQALVQGLGTSGARLTVVLRRLTAGEGEPPAGVRHESGAWPVRLRGLVFAYGPGAAPVVDRLDLTVPAGERLAVAGPSGIGKSTLLGLIAGVLRPDAGEVTTGCERVLVPQEAYVFTATLRENLGYFSPQLPCDEALSGSAEAVGAGPLLERLGGLDAVLDPAALSAAERQLVALARAHVAPAPLVLLDEATCHLDPAAEARAERAFAGRTLVVVAHRTGSARRADRVLLMDGARAELGTHEELLARSAFYRDLTGADPSHPPLPLGDPYRVDPVAGAGLASDGGHVVAHGAVGKMEPERDVGDRGSFRGE